MNPTHVEVLTANTTYIMKHRTFNEYVRQRDEGLWLPNQPVVASLGKVNPLPASQARLDRIRVKPVKPTQQAAAAVPKVIPSPISQHVKAINRVFG